MKTLLIVGIGAGDPDFLTFEALRALRQADQLWLFDKGCAKQGLLALRKTLIERHGLGDGALIVEAPQPERDSAAEDYPASLTALDQRKQRLFEQLLDGLPDGQCAAHLVWGDPGLYDGTLRIAAAIARAREDFDFAVIPGVSSLQVLAARHRIALADTGGTLRVTPARRLQQAPGEHERVAVMLDAEGAYRQFVGQGLWIWWGAYLGMPQQLLRAGPLDELADELGRLRAEARNREGWIMDCYVLE